MSRIVSVYLSVCLSVGLSISLSVCLSVHLSDCPSVWKVSETVRKERNSGLLLLGQEAEKGSRRGICGGENGQRKG
jgi:hypothetical protein